MIIKCVLNKLIYIKIRITYCQGGGRSGGERLFLFLKLDIYRKKVEKK